MDDTQSNIEVVTGALGAIESGDVDGALKRFEEDARWGVAKVLPNAGMHDGAAGIRKLLGDTRERFSGGYRFLHVNEYATPDHVFAEVTRASGDDAYAAGAEHVMLSFHVVLGRIREVREFLYAIH